MCYESCADNQENKLLDQALSSINLPLKIVLYNLHLKIIKCLKILRKLFTYIIVCMQRLSTMPRGFTTGLDHLYLS